MSELRLFTSESVTEGHPDKICDQISDGILDSLLAQDPGARVAVETLVTTGQVHVAGEIRTSGYADIPGIVRKVITDIGYVSSDFGFDGHLCGVSVSVGEQSAEIASGVETSLQHRDDLDSDEIAKLGAGDQGIMFGYATDETPELMPLPIWLAHRLSERLTQVRKQGILSYLRPDGKTQVTVGYDGDVPRTVETVVVSTQHGPEVSRAELEADIKREVIDVVLAHVTLDTASLKVFINPAGPFVLGGPAADAGLTGRKIIVDTYGGMARHGGGAFSGKDPSKVDRSAAYAMRWVAKNVIAAGFAKRVEFQVAYAIGSAEPVGLYCETFGTHSIEPERIVAAVKQVFDLRPGAIIRDLDLNRPIYSLTSAYGHFGRELPEFTWERTDRAEALRAAVNE